MKTNKVRIGKHEIGSDFPIQIQSMIIADAMDTDKAIEEIIALYEEGCPLIRLSIPSINEAQNLKIIKEQLEERGFDIPLVADIHFTPKAAIIAAKYVEKVRINPGNFADKKQFDSIDYTEEEYEQELQRIEDKLKPFIDQCIAYKTAIRIGVNHGSLSDRITSYYGDTALGMVESAVEYLSIFRKFDFKDIVVSLKASNPKVMMDANRLFTKKQIENSWNYPIHLGVTEAGFGEDGRIKSALGIGTLLKEGIGDTIRVSLTEDAIHEIPVAKYIAQKFSKNVVPNRNLISEGPFEKCKIVLDLTERQDLHSINFKDLGYRSLDGQWVKSSQAVDYIIYDGQIGSDTPAELIILRSKPMANYKYCLEITIEDINKGLRPDDNAVLIIESISDGGLIEYREILNALLEKEIYNEVILTRKEATAIENSRIQNAVYIGGILADGFAHGLCIRNFSLSVKEKVELSFAIAQAAGRRMTKAEFISCPSCGRTQFDLQEVTTEIKARTEHLDGLKIGIMGCIVNGPGEMAGADYGYVGSGKGKITLYQKREVVERNIPSEKAVDALIQLIKRNGDWKEPINS